VTDPEMASPLPIGGRAGRLGGAAPLRRARRSARKAERRVRSAAEGSREKPRGISSAGPYRERTHVVWWSTPRRASELLSRNSAKLLRKLAIRGAPLGGPQ
jgi:hypothetical protein